MQSAGPLLFGIEHEVFVLDRGLAPRPDRTDALFQRLAAASGAALTPAEEGHIYGVRAQTPQGPVEVKHDFATHLLEFAFPPLGDAQEFLGLFSEWTVRVQGILDDLNLQLQPGGLLGELPTQTWLSTGPSDPGGRRRAFWETIPARGLAFTRLPFNAVMASTQVNLSYTDEESVPVLADLYRFEYLVPFAFSQSAQTGARCARPLIYADTLPADFPLVNVPRRLPSTLEGHRAFTASAIRDYSAIAPRGDHLEFRSACSQPDAPTILELSALRIATTLAVGQGPRRSLSASADLFLEACAADAAPRVLDEDLALLRSLEPQLPPGWRGWFQRSLARVGSSG